MSLIPFILELADELHEFNRCLATGGMDVDDFGFGIYPHELQPQQQQSPQQQQQSQHPLQQQQQAQQQHLSQQRRPRTLSQFYWLPNISKSRHHPYYRGKPCCNKTPIHLVHDHQLEKETSSTAGGGGGGGGGGSGVINSSPTAAGANAADKELTATSAHGTNSTNSSNSTGNSAAGKSAYSVVNKNGFQVSMNVKQFAPNELTVKTIDNCIVVEGQHEDKEDGHGVISRHFIRKYMLPKGYDPSEVLSTLSSDGILTVKAPPPALKTDETTERIVDIQQTGGPVQIQQSAAKEPTNVASSGKETQTSAATAVTQTVTDAAAVAAVSLPTAVATTLQKQQQPQQEKQQNQQTQKMSATVEGVQQQQQQPMKLSQATTKDLQVTRERNGKLEPNELLAEPETETRTAEQTATSSNTSTNNIANNNNINTNSNNNSGDTNMDCSELKTAVTSKATSQTEVKETESAVDNDEPTLAIIENVNNKAPHASDVTKSSSTIDAIMADATADEPMETEEELDTVTNEEVVAQKPIVVSIPTADTEDDAASANNIDGGVNSAVTAATTNNNTTSNDIVTPTNDTASAVEANGIENNTANNIDIDLAPATVAEASEIVLVTNNGVSDDKTAATGDGLTISLETTVAEIDGVTDMDTDIADVADVVDSVVDADGLDGGVIAIGIDAIGVGVDVNVITADGNNATAQNVEDGNEENLSTGNLVVAAQSPTPADLVAAADAAILLAKTQCDGGAGDVAASKPALNTEEITN
ncbi:heat shock protein 67B1 [Bactrocera dorsalis]|uniref:Heat shock protein 67B1 n=1 Tax=Bactrocera dorsalis TaxID=27457 RepID=A0A6I9UR98_BACDO|nr:heat shock protein 67B1 [Bactrocera dorsalis]